MDSSKDTKHVMSRYRKILLLGLPIALFLTTAAAFLYLTSWLRKPVGYLLGFLFYWFFWCLIVPRTILGKDTFRTLLTDRVSLFTRNNWPALLLIIVVTAVTLVMYLSKFLRSTWILMLLSFPCAVIDGTCEEILWRATYVRVFVNTPLLAIFYPSLGFAAWHFVPQMVYPASSGTLIFVLSTFFLGICYGFVAYRTGSAKWTAISHSASCILALSGMIA